MNHAVWRSSQQPWNTYLLPNGLWKSPINLTLSWVFLEQRSLATARQVPARCWVKLWRDLVTNQICKLGLCCSVKDTAQAQWLASTWSNRIDYWGLFRVFFFSMLENKSSCFTSCCSERHLLRTRSLCHVSPNFCCSSFTGLCAREGILVIPCLHANIC